jgi:hypothetical protein
MTMTSVYASMSEIVKRLKLEMPMQVTIHDPITGHEVALARENILAMLVIDTPNLVYDSQWLAALYMEMARARRASERASAHADRQFVKWKAEVAAKARADAGKKITGAEAEEAYRTHPEYEQRASVAAYYKTLADLFEDAMQAFTLKGRMIEAQSRILHGDFHARRVEDRTASGGEHTAAHESTEDLSSRAQGALDTVPGTTGSLPGMPALPPAPPTPPSRKPRGM